MRYARIVSARFQSGRAKAAPKGLACHAGTLNATYPMIENATSAAANHPHTGAFDSMIGPPAASKRNRRARAIVDVLKLKFVKCPGGSGPIHLSAGMICIGSTEPGSSNAARRCRSRT
jgi:hypothetical protein